MSAGGDKKTVDLSGMMREDAHLLQSVEGPYHSNTERSREVNFVRKKEDDQSLLEEKACQYYQDDWVLTEEEL